jgi:hypothetical protein
MKTLFIAIAFLFSIACRADIKYVRFDRIDSTGKYHQRFQFLLDNLVYYDHWSQAWPYPVAKDSLINELKASLAIVEPLRADALESNLLLGEIAHYLYNLDQQMYYDTAEAYYLKAIKVADKDCRGHWFLGYFYAQADEIVKGAQHLETAREMVDSETPIEFWQEYAWGMLLADKPSHERMALDNFLHGGGSSLLAQTMDSSLRSNVRPADPDSVYTPKELWERDGAGVLDGFISRPLGIRLKVDSSWNMHVQGYKNRLSVFVMKPGTLTSAKGATIGYTIGMVVKVAGKEETLEQFMATMMKGSGTKDASFAFSGLYSHGMSYTYQDKGVYADRGGAHIHFIGIERDCPEYPGLALEQQEQTEELKGKPGELQFMKMNFVRNRFPGRIFYFFILDTCEDIYQVSWNTFRAMMAKQMVLD